MPLWKVRSKRENNTFTCDILHTDKPTFGYDPSNYGKTVIVSRFLYHVKHVDAPALTDKGGKRYLLPTNEEVHPKTTINDVKWDRILKPSEINEYVVESKDNLYIVKQKGEKFTCNCPGYKWVRNKRKGCKHVQEVKSKLK